MLERDLRCAWAQAVLVVAIGALLSAGVANLLIAVTESVLWPVFVGVGWVAVAAGVTVKAEAATPFESRTLRAAPPQLPANVSTRRE